MKDYVITTYREKESEKVIKCLNSYDINEINRSKGIMCHEYLRFKCKKDTWKSIKKELNLEVVSVYSSIRVQ